MVGMDRRQVLVGLGALTLAPRVAAEPRRVEIRPKVQQVIEGGRTHTLSDTIFEVPSDYAGQEIGLKIGPEAVIDVLRIRVAPGAHDIDRFMQIGPGVHIGLLDVEATRQTDHSDEKLDGFVQIRADDISIEEMRFNRIDRCVLVHRAARVRIGSFECKSYSKGMRISRSRDVTIGRFRAAASSPNAVLGKPGEKLMGSEDGPVPQNAEEAEKGMMAHGVTVMEIAMTDGKGDRSLRPHAQSNPDAYVRITERGPGGIVIRGVKAIVAAMESGDGDGASDACVAMMRDQGERALGVLRQRGLVVDDT